MPQIEGVTIDTSSVTARKNSGYSQAFVEAENTAKDEINRGYSQLSSLGDSDGGGIVALTDGTDLNPNGAAGLTVVQYNDMPVFSNYFTPGTVSSPLDQITGDTNEVGSNYINVSLGSPEAISKTLNTALNIPVSESITELNIVADNSAEAEIGNVQITLSSGFGITFTSTLNRVNSTFGQLVNSFSDNLVQDIALKNDNSYRNQIISLGVDDPEVVDEILTLMMNDKKQQAFDRTIQYLEENVYDSAE